MGSCPRCERFECLCGEPDYEARPVIDRLLSLMERMTNDQRQRVMIDIAERYCRHCGGEQPLEGRRCQCWNDE